ncbi:ABC1 kinase family protein [Aestuariimicrobium ganziense]|uniref:ABC1 kinase family protein n=1 Tax=Aestuariimicrobium ganziense TaxID=2773677 RepID=UPI001944063E|nr:AarF/UbiB family protein [Aestuariimicrobium ganziense]
MSNAARLAKLVRLAAKHSGLGLSAAKGDPEFLVDADPADLTPGRPDELAGELEELGPTFVKLGQLMSTRYDLLPPAYSEALGRLQDGVEPFDAAEARQIIEYELGAPVSTLFTEFDDTPLASASLGQVHRGITRSGRDVVVKVQRPGVREQVRDDMELLSSLAGLVDQTKAGQRVGTAAMLAHFRRSLADELDYRKEASNLERFGALTADEKLIAVPAPLRDYSTSRVLTMERVVGRKVTDIGPLGLMDLDGPELADALFRFTLTTLLSEGLLHADPHPGNLLVNDQGQVAIIDLGMVATIPRRVQSRLIKLLLAVAEGDGEGAAVVLAGMGHPLDDYDAAAFRDDVSHLVSGTVALGAELQAGSVLVELARMSGAHGLRPPAEMSMVGKALLNLDQATQHLDPDFVPVDAIAEHLPRVLVTSMAPTPATVATSALETKEFVQDLPRRANRIMDQLTEGELALRVHAIDEDRVLRQGQKWVNRLTTGIVLAAITVAAALMMGVEGGPRLFGYPAVAMLFFLMAAITGFGLVISIFLTDRRVARRAKHSEDRRDRIPGA